MTTIIIQFTFGNGDDEVIRDEEFDVDCCLEDSVNEYVAETLEGLGDDWDCKGEEIIDWDGDFADPNDFDGYSAYSDYVEACEKHGEGYVLRYADINDNANMDSYCGCWESMEAYVKHELDENYDVPDFLTSHIDYESVAREWGMDYSTYDGDEGTHIFRD